MRSLIQVRTQSSRECSITGTQKHKTCRIMEYAGCAETPGEQNRGKDRISGQADSRNMKHHLMYKITGGVCTIIRLASGHWMHSITRHA